MPRFEPLDTDPSAIRACLESAQEKFRALEPEFQEALGSPQWDRLTPTDLFPWLCFATPRELFAGRPYRALVATLLMGVGESLLHRGELPLLVAVDFRDGAAKLIRLRAGPGVWAVRDTLATLTGRRESVTLALASEMHRGNLGWLLSEAGQRAFVPVFAERFRLRDGEMLSGQDEYLARLVH